MKDFGVDANATKSYSKHLSTSWDHSSQEAGAYILRKMVKHFFKVTNKLRESSVLMSEK